jgi:hypothetical protein
LNAFTKAKTIKSNKSKIVIKGKPINTKGKSPGEPKHDLLFGFIKKKLNKTKAIIIIRKTINRLTKCN